MRMRSREWRLAIPLPPHRHYSKHRESRAESNSWLYVGLYSCEGGMMVAQVLFCLVYKRCTRLVIVIIDHDLYIKVGIKSDSSPL